MLTTDRHEASRGLSAIAELTVFSVTSMRHFTVEFAAFGVARNVCMTPVLSAQYAK